MRLSRVLRGAAILGWIAILPNDVQSEPLFEAPFLGFSSDGIGGPSHVAHADLNADGHQDLVVCHPLGADPPPQPDRAVIWLGNGDGTFREASFIPFMDARCAAIGDLNGDGKPDLAIAGGDQVLIALGHGDGTFSNLVIPYGQQLTSCALADMDRDHQLDLVTCSASSQVVSIRRGNGDGTFSAFKTDYPAGERPFQVAVADLNADGVPDVVTPNSPFSMASAVSVFLGTRTGSLAPRTDYAMTSCAYVAIGDVNEDGQPDIAVNSNFTNEVAVLLNDGTGAFTPGPTIATFGPPRGIVLADLNEDGHQDLAVDLSPSVPGLEVHLGTGPGTFQSATRWVTSDTPTFLDDGDFNDDGHVDLLVVGGGSDTYGFSVMLGDANGGFGIQRHFSTAGHPVDIETGDLDGDGQVDLAVACTAGMISVGLGIGGGAFGPTTNIRVVPGPTGLALGDFNSDGHLDMAISLGGTDSVAVGLGLGNGTFGPMAKFQVGNAPKMVATGDLDGDGHLDLVVPNGGASSFTVLFGDGAGSFHVRTDFVTPLPAVALALADLNGDGALDVAVVNRNDFSALVSTWLGDGTGGLTRGTDLAGNRLQCVAIGDVNADGRPDVVAGVGGEYVEVWPGKGDGTFQPPLFHPMRGELTSLALADFDLDGKTDIACATAHANWIGVIASSGGGEVQYFGSGTNVVATHAADIDGNGTVDLIGANASQANTTLILNTKSVLAVPRQERSRPALDAFPNPARVSASIRFVTPRSAHVSARVYDMTGRLVRRLYDGTVLAGSTTLSWDLRHADGHRVAPGVYAIELRGADSIQRRRITVIR